jgi:hypothetical protein
MPVSETSLKGELALMKVIFRAFEKRITVSRPVGDFDRYDLIIDEGGKLSRVQVKYADGKPASNGSVRVKTQTNHRRGGQRKYSPLEVDCVMVYLPQTGKVYRLPPYTWGGKTEISLRLTPAKNGQKKDCWFAGGYEW